VEGDTKSNTLTVMHPTVEKEDEKIHKVGLNDAARVTEGGKVNSTTFSLRGKKRGGKGATPAKGENKDAGFHFKREGGGIPREPGTKKKKARQSIIGFEKRGNRSAALGSPNGQKEGGGKIDPKGGKPPRGFPLRGKKENLRQQWYYPDSQT